MECPACQKEITPESYFCTWCSKFIPSPGKGQKANLFARWIALVIDPMIAVILYVASIGVVGRFSQNLAVLVAILLPLVYLIWYLSLFRKGQTPGKMILGLQVVNQQTGEIPGFGKMFLRELVGRFLSGLFLGLGYFWALFDKNAQAWHDKLAGTVVLRVSG